MATPSYSLTATSTSVTIHVAPAAGYTFYRLFLRRTDDTTGSNMILSSDPHYNVTEPFSVTVTGLSPKTSYTANVYYGPDNTAATIVIGAQSITTGGEGRPDNFSWTTNVTKGATVPKYGENLAPITADEWISFCSRINQFREYKSLSTYSFTSVSQGTPMTAAIINQAITAISGISGHGTLPTPNDAILASFWQQLAAALNAIT